MNFSKRQWSDSIAKIVLIIILLSRHYQRGETKERRRLLDIGKSHVNDAYVMGDFHPLHRAHLWILQKKRCKNRILEKFYDAKYIDIRDGKKRSGQELFNGRTSRNHDRDTENLHRYRGGKVSKGRRSIRK